MSNATVKQINFAKDIAEWFGVDLPGERTKEAYSEFLNQYADAYRNSMREEAIYHEAHLEAIDARRDW